ncbi:MAG TPA: sigma 54-interacting transcriptional regulator [Steroidobacteraceae bacterium]|nr:sigma 54-interacting transcriptional regulator [Steroidobacteraceae bacterium]
MSSSQSPDTGQRVADEDLGDLFEEAPVAYVHEDMDTRFIRANRAAREILGIAAEEVSRTIGTSLVIDTPDAQQNVRDALERLRIGGRTEHRVLELRRADNGQHIWVQWWSKAAPSGSYTRSMFIDITQQVLLEQERARLTAQNVYLQEEIKSDHNFEEIIGATAGLAPVMAKVTRVAPTDASVLITGESGTGKELIARALHSRSARAEKPFIKVNCAALPIGLVESELFGHERGAFSGAIQRRIGRFELADTGTIFLDEIGEMPVDVQVKLLRVLQEHEFERIGNSHPIRADVRVVAATNRDLQKSMHEGKFRADLFYRLNVFPIALPPLRERLGDIPVLTHFFVQKHASRLAKRIEAVDAESLRRLAQYSWPGNIRELENVVERALILGSSPILRIEPDFLGIEESNSIPALEEAALASAALSPTTGRDLDSIQREHILSVLQEVHWVIEGRDGAAVRLGLKPGTLRHRMKRLGIKRSQASST